MYFSSGLHPRAEDYAEEAIYWREQGWKGYKLHPPTAPYAVSPEVAPVQADIDGCVAVHEAVGGTMALMLDASWAYSYAEALTVGRAIEELGFTWYEDPLPAEDLYGCRKLVQHLDIPVLATELTLGGLYTLPQWITERATDMLRGDVVIKGGITGMMKIGHLAEAFHMKCEVHDAYNAMNNVATAHLVMAMPNCDWFEVLAFNRAGDHSLEHLSYGLSEPLHIDGEGYLHAPTAPGLGVGVDWERIDSARIGVMACLADGGRLQLDEHLGEREPRDAQQRRRGLAAGLVETRNERRVRAEERIDVGREDVEPDDVGERHPGLAQDRLDVVQRHADLGDHVARVRRLAPVVDRGLAGDVDGPPAGRDGDAVHEAVLLLPGPRVDDLCVHVRAPSHSDFRAVSLAGEGAGSQHACTDAARR